MAIALRQTRMIPLTQFVGALLDGTLLFDETDGLAIDFTDTTHFDEATWDQDWNQVRTSSVDVYSSPHTFYTNTGTSPKVVKISSTGLGWSPHNLILQSQTFTTTWTDGGGSTAADATTAPDGTLTADTYTEGGNELLQTGTFLAANLAATSSWYLKAGTCTWIRIVQYGVNGNNQGWFNLSTGAAGSVSNVGNASDAAISIEDVGSGWYRCSLTGIPSTDTAISQFYLIACTADAGSTRDTGKTVHVWGAQLNRGYVATAYIVTTTTAKYGLPISYGEGLLVESAATNLCLGSEDFSVWANDGTADTANTTTAPDGSTTADTITENSAAGRHMIFNNRTVTTGPGVGSVYLKRKDRQWASVSWNEGASNKYGIVVDLDTGTITDTNTAGTASAPVSSVTSIGNGWYRVAVGFTTTGNNIYFQVGLSDSATPTWSSGNASYTGDNASGMYVWGGQMETGSVATSYIPITTVSVTRATDAPSVATSAYPHSATNGTFVTWITKRIVNATNADRVLSINDTTANERIQLVAVTADTPDSFGLDITDGGVLQVDSTVTKAGSTSSSGNKTAFFYKANDSGVLIDAGTEVVDVSCSMPTVTNLQLGYDGVTASRELNGFIRRLIYVPRRMTEAEMQAHTT